MNLGKILYRVGELRSPGGDPLDVDIKEFVNLAVQMIAERTNWSFMRSTRTVTVEAGQTSAPLGEGFKQLTQERSPVSWSDATVTGGLPIPVTVMSREEMQRRGWWPLSRWASAGTTYVGGLGVYLDLDSGTKTLNIPSGMQTSADIEFSVSAYYYPEELVAAGDSNAMTDHGILSDAVVNLAKAMAYQAVDPTDARGAACEAIFDKRLKSALYADASLTLAGRTLRG